MIGFLRGKIVQLAVDYCLIDVHGVGYRVFIPTSTRDKLTTGHDAMLYTYLAVREDALLLYGFVSQEEYGLFLQLLAVSGIGPKAALAVLSAINPKAFAAAIGSRDMAVLTKISGIGKKTAERMVLELKDKLGIIVPDDENAGGTIPNISGGGSMQEALEALLSLGYSQAEVVPLLKNVAADASTEDIIKAVLKEFGGRK